MKTTSLALLGFLWLVAPHLSEAACFSGPRDAGQSAAYQFAVAYIDSIVAADKGMKRISAVAKRIEPTLVHVTEGLRDYELAARDFDCAALAMEPQRRFASGSSDMARQIAELARLAATEAELLYRQLAETTREIASALQGTLDPSTTDRDTVARLSRASADLDDIPRTVFAHVAPSVPHVLVDPEPDSSGRMSRMRITKQERDDLIKMLDTAFGERVTRQKKGDRPAFDAAAALFRQWLADGSYTFKNR